MYENEIAFLREKLKYGRKKTNWKVIKPLEQIMSDFLSPDDAKTIYSHLEGELGLKCQRLQKPFNTIFSVNTGHNGTRVLVKVPLFREVFGDEIDRRRGGGGRKLKVNPNPTTTTMRR